MMDLIAATIGNEYSENEDLVNVRERDFPLLVSGGELSAGSVSIGIALDYVPDWTARDAFREFFQNWKDDILDKNGLESDQLLFDIEATEDAYIATARAAGVDRRTVHLKKMARTLGFIKYSKKDGVLQLTNFKSYLTTAVLSLGISTKRNKAHLAGTHGEGFKIASNIMLNEGYQVRMEASRFYWKFKHLKDNLHCIITPASNNKIQKDMENETEARMKGIQRGLTANIWEDVTVKIGKVYRPWSESARIEFADFQSWLVVSLDLERPFHIIKTPHGSLILDLKFQGRLYLRELLLETNDPLTARERELKYAYNLRTGKVNRDRQSLSSSSEKARGFALIWKEAIQNNPVDNLKNYVELLQEDERWADVNRSARFIDRITAEAIWEYHLKADPERKRFYYCHESGKHDVEIIRNSLKRDPVQLSSAIWESLRRWGLVRTPQEQQCCLLQSAPLSNKTETLYSSGVKRALSAALSVDERTRELNLSFRSGHAAGLDLLIDGAQILVNERCLDFYDGHVTNPCRLATLASTRAMNLEIFSCDHIVLDLYELVLGELMKSSESNNSERTLSPSSLYLKVSESLREMPRKIEMTQGPETGEIEVSWADFASDMDSRLHGMDIKGQITLHRERTCSSKKLQLLAQEEDFENKPHMAENDSPISLHQTTADCGCPQQVVSLKDSKAIFYQLDLAEEYFPLIVRVYAQGFFGLPPPPMRPKSREESADPENRGSAMVAPHPLHSANFEDSAGNDDLYGVSDGDGDYMQVDLPYRSPQLQEPNPSIEAAQPPTSVARNRTPKSSNSQSTQLFHTPSRLTSAGYKLEMARQQDVIKVLHKQLRDVKQHLEASTKELESTRLKLENLQTDYEAKEQAHQAKDVECRDLQSLLKSMHLQAERAREQSQVLLTEIQDLRQAHESLNEQLRNRNNEHQDLRAEAQREELQSMRDKALDERKMLDDAQKTIELLRGQTAGSQRIPEREPESQDFHAVCEEEIEQLKDRVRRLRETRISLEKELKEARRDAQEGHASTREALRHMMSVRETESRRPGRTGGSLFREPSASEPWTRVKRESVVDEGEGSAASGRASKRIKQEGIVDLTD